MVRKQTTWAHWLRSAAKLQILYQESQTPIIDIDTINLSSYGFMGSIISGTRIFNFGTEYPNCGPRFGFVPSFIGLDWIWLGTRIQLPNFPAA